MKRLAIGGLIILLAVGFMEFVPVVSVGAATPTTGGVSVEFPANETSTASLGSIAYCYFGQGAVFVQGVYYPLAKAGINNTGMKVVNLCSSLGNFTRAYPSAQG